MGESTQLGQPLFTRQSLIKLIWPLVIEQLLLMTVGMSETVMVTTAGEAVVSGVSLVDNVNILLIQIFAALGTGGAVVVSQYLGRRDVEKARSGAKQLIYVSAIAATAIMVLALVFREHVLRLLFGKISAEVMDSAMMYFFATALAYPFMAIYNAGSALFRTMGNSRISMFCSLVVNVVNIGVNALLIFGFHLGALGAGIGTLVSRIVAAVIMLTLLQHDDCLLKLERVFHPELRWPMVKRILGIGIPNGLENGMFQVGKLLVLSLITSFDYGVDLAVAGSAVAANGIANSIAGVLNVPGQAMGLALVTVVGQCMGAGEEKQAVSYTKKLMVVTYISMGLMAILCFFTAGPLASLFKLSVPTTAIVVQVLKVNSVFLLLFWPMSFTLPNALRASGDALFTMIVSLLSMFIFRIGFSFVLGADTLFGAPMLGLHLMGTWLAMFIDWIVRAIVFFIRFATGGWKKHKVI